MFSNTLGRHLHEYVRDYCVFDLETTGTDPKKNMITEIGAIRVLGGEIDAEFSQLVNPGIPIPPYITEITGINDEMVADAPPVGEALEMFMDFAGDLPLVGHNIIQFDLKYIYRFARECHNKTIGNDYIDTLPLANTRLPALSHHRLGDLATHYGVEVVNAHRALGDCRMNQVVYERLMQENVHRTDDVRAEEICPQCGKAMKIRNGKFGEFWGCTGYPLCKFTKNLTRV